MTVAIGEEAIKKFPVTSEEVNSYITEHEAWATKYLKHNKIPFTNRGGKLSIKDKRFFRKVEDRIRATKISAQTGSDISVTQGAED